MSRNIESKNYKETRMKKFTIVFVFLLFLFALSSCNPIQDNTAIQESSAVQIPAVLGLVLNGFLATLFTAAFVFLFEKFNLDLRGYATGLAVIISGYIVAQAQGYINTLPVSVDPWLDMLFRILVVVLVPVGTLRLISRKPATLLPRE